MPMTRHRSVPRIGKYKWNPVRHKKTFTSSGTIGPTASVSATKNTCS
jgi:hypothetical protein